MATKNEKSTSDADEANLNDYNFFSQYLEYRDNDLFWRVSRGRAQAGDFAGTYNHTARRYQVGLHYRVWALARIIWLLHYRRWPAGEIEYRDGNSQNNAIGNLRDETHGHVVANSKFRANNQTGCRGVSYKHDAATPWIVDIRRDCKIYFSGCYETYEEAEAVAVELYSRIHAQEDIHPPVVLEQIEEYDARQA